MPTEPGPVDPYVYPGTDVLRNLLDEHDAARLTEREYTETYLRRVELDEHPPTGPFDLARLQETHRRLFQDLYSWAGQLRTVEIRKGSSQFHPSAYLRTAAAETFDWLSTSTLLQQNVDDDRFVTLASTLLEKLNFIHPFREGNGRSQRAFLDQVAHVSSHSLAWRNISHRDYLLASIRAFEAGDGKPFHSVFTQAIQPPLDGLSMLEPSAYLVTPATSVRPPRQRKDLHAARQARRRPLHPQSHEDTEAEKPQGDREFGD